MSYKIERLCSNVMYSIDRMTSEQWLVISAIAIFLGVIFLRGYGSRTTY
jgi:hypothetical protein